MMGLKHTAEELPPEHRLNTKTTNFVGKLSCARRSYGLVRRHTKEMARPGGFIGTSAFVEKGEIVFASSTERVSRTTNCC